MEAKTVLLIQVGVLIALWFAFIALKQVVRKKKLPRGWRRARKR